MCIRDRGEAAWISGGVPIGTNWQPSNTTGAGNRSRLSDWHDSVGPATNLSCEAGCEHAGHCCTGLVSSYNHPSCAMGCALAEQTAKVEQCIAHCHQVDNRCSWKIGNLSGNNCGSCGKGCDASDGVGECVTGCQLAFGDSPGLNVWETGVAEDEVSSMLGLMTVEPHTRLMRARWPNPPSGTQELRPVKKVQPLGFAAPRIKPKAAQVFLNATARDGFDSSILEHYNAYASANCQAGVQDPDCPCGAWSDVRGGNWSSGSYWCSDKAAGGWAEMDTGNGYYNGPALPTGLEYDPAGDQSRFDSYANAVGAIVVAWRAQGWFNNMFEVEAHNKSSHSFTWSKGGFQGGRGWQVNGTTGAIEPVPPFFIENVFEELDAPSEWYFDESARKLYLFWNATAGTPPPAGMQFVVPTLHRLISIVGTSDTPVRGVTIRGLGFRDAAYTYMSPWGVPSGGDWALHRGGALFIEGTQATTVQGCLFRRVDGNALFLSGYNRDALLDRNEFNWIGDSAMAAWGYTDEHDGTGGDQPRNTTVSSNLCHELGIFQLQSSCWFQAKTAQTLLKGNLFFNGPRAGINFNDGFGGGNRVTQNVIFNQCRQSGDHGPINSWDRQLFWTDVRDGKAHPGWNPGFNEIDTNVIMANYGGSQGFDNDDGSSWYDIHHNVIYGEGLKQDYGGHDSKYHDNLNLVHQYDGQNCINTWPFKSGQGPCGDWSNGTSVCSHAHHFEQNKCVVLYTDVYSPGAGGCPPGIETMAYLANNRYYTPTAGNASIKGCGSLGQIQKGGNEIGSESLGLPTDEQWMEWANQILGWEHGL
eukprot:TRINITY_DN9700_c0_g1_i1.p1 TRINITY_DN9700_c0_g1~~TRINITY_DN9700_c0_g1_i1.p1  ORF type:complete len:811 (+),score=166.33 TRINITY_DN9700_c0_g1_i1:197-2629(+)